MELRISKHPLKKRALVLPTSKSQTMRALIFALLASGTSTIHYPLDSPDTDKMLEAIIALGATVKKEGHTLYITGTGGALTMPGKTLDTGGSGLVYRFITALIALADHPYTITDLTHGVENRPIRPLLEALEGAGHVVQFLTEAKAPPYQIKKGNAKPHYEVEGSDSQMVSALLMLAAFKGEKVSLTVRHPGELPFVKMTLAWLRKLDIEVFHSEDFTQFTVHRKAVVAPFTYEVPADYSALMYPIGMGLVSNSEVVIDNIDLNDSQGDKVIMEKLALMGADLNIDQDKRQLTLRKSALSKGLDIDMSECIDAISFFAVLGCFIKSGRMRLFNAGVARTKECDRLSATYKELKKMGANIEEHKECLIIYPSTLHPASLNSYGDHRMVLAFSVAAFALNQPSLIQKASCIEKTYRHFARDMNQLGANIEVIT